MIEKSRKMKDITLQEISYVDKPANKRGFLLFKRDGKSSGDSFSKAKKKINIEIISDGTKGGTKITLNGDTIDKLESFNFSIWSESEDKSKINCSYSKLVESEGGFERTESYYLAKSGENIMDKRLEKLLKQLFGDKEVKLEKSELNEDTIIELEKALTTINEYKDDFPNDLTAAIGLVAIHAGQGYKESESVEKVGAKLSKDTVAKLKSIIDAATAMLPKEAGDDDSKTKKSDDDPSELQKTIDILSKSIADITGKLEKKEATDQLTQITEIIEKVSDRLKIVESKPATTKKSIDDDPTKKTEVKKDSQGREIGHWPSLTGKADEDEE